MLAANAAGGLEGLVGYLKKQALLENPSPFMTGLSKLLPMMLEGNPDAPLIVERVYYTRDEDMKSHAPFIACAKTTVPNGREGRPKIRIPNNWAAHPITK